MILLDTHTLIWFRDGIRNLGRQAITRIDRELSRGRAWYSPVSIFEHSLLLERGRLKSRATTLAWHDAINGMGFIESPLDSAIAIRAGEIIAALGDPNDALITATAIERGLHLVTADERILGWKGPLRRLDARR